MTDPFAAALDALFSAPGAAAAVYQPADGEPYAIRVIRGQSDELGPRNTVQGTNVIDLRRSEVPAPRHGEVISIGGTIVDGAITGGEMLALYGEPRLDVEGITWTIGAVPLEP